MSAIVPSPDRPFGAGVDGPVTRQYAIVAGDPDWGDEKTIAIPERPKRWQKDLLRSVSITHSFWVNMLITRYAVMQALIGRKIWARYGGKEGAQIVIDPPIPQLAVPWNAYSAAFAGNASLFGRASKMATPSFSLPAGPRKWGGTCPAADAGISPMTFSARKSKALFIAKEEGRVEWWNSVCQWCYAADAFYLKSSKQTTAMVVYLWTRQALRTREFVPFMVEAIRKQAKFRIEGIYSQKQQKWIWPKEPSGRKYFRIHDSGDFFNLEYIKAWRAIADALPDVTFWAPTRTHYFPEFRDEINRVNRDSQNLVIRPSGFCSEKPAPVPGQGNKMEPRSFAGGTTVTPLEKVKGLQQRGFFDINCPAYEMTEDEAHTCRHAKCRRCWDKPEETINYTLHGTGAAKGGKKK